MKRHYLAVDLGASSGRTIVGTLDDGVLTLKEMNRFWNGPTEIGGTLHWDFVHLFRHIREGIDLARAEYGDGLVSMGIDTWGVDFGLFDKQGRLLGNPVNYRDSRTQGKIGEVAAIVPKEEIYGYTGVQFMELNSLYQMFALKQEGSVQYEVADKLLFVPDLLNYWLTGNMVAERSFASTSQCYDPAARNWAFEMLEKLGLRTDLFADLVDPGTVIGDTDGLPVVAVGSHDTASAFAAVPVADGEECGFLSSGTWALLGAELPEPVKTPEALAANFTNEVGVCDTVRFLKNLSGMWMIQELRRNWNAQGADYSWMGMEKMAAEAEPFQFCVDPSDEMFVQPGEMPETIREYCRKTGQKVPETHTEILRATYEGLAFLYADTFAMLESVTGKALDTLRIVGGGSKDRLLNQLAANALNRRVVSGPTEATAIGNLTVQMLAMGDIASLSEGRAIIRKSFGDEGAEFLPQDADVWAKGLARWQSVCK